MSHVLSWSEAAADYLERQAPPPGSPVQVALEQLTRVDLSDIARAMDPDDAAAAKPETTAFFLAAIERALADHMLTDDEIVGLRRMRLIFRIEDGDLVEHHPEAVARLLCKELEVVFADRGIDAQEAIHKVKLQELFGLGYDDFIALAAPEIDRLRDRLLEALETSDGAAWLGDDAQQVLDRVAAVDMINLLNLQRQVSDSLAGYLYLLINPAMPGMVKVGRTSRRPERRASELAGATGVPTPFVVAFDLYVADARAAEAHAHARLEEAGYRVAVNREFFSCSPSEAVRVMLEAGDAVA
jgi:hypothetical protein